MSKLTGTETEALLELASSKWPVWTESREGHIADMVLRGLCVAGLAHIERVNATCHEFTITPAGRLALTAAESKQNGEVG